MDCCLGKESPHASFEHMPCARAARHKSWLHTKLTVFGWGGGEYCAKPQNPKLCFQGFPVWRLADDIKETVGESFSKPTFNGGTLKKDVGASQTRIFGLGFRT